MAKDKNIPQSLLKKTDIFCDVEDHVWEYGPVKIETDGPYGTVVRFCTRCWHYEYVPLRHKK